MFTIHIHFIIYDLIYHTFFVVVVILIIVVCVVFSIICNRV